MPRFSPGVIYFLVFAFSPDHGFTYSDKKLESLSVESSVFDPLRLENVTTDTLSFEKATQLAKALLEHPVVIAHFLLRDTLNHTKNISVNIDSSITRVLVGIRHENQDHLNDLQKEIDGYNRGDTGEVLKGSDWKIDAISNPTKGKWPLHIIDSTSYELIFIGESKVDFGISIVDKETGEIKTENPLAGSVSCFMVTISNIVDLCNTSRFILVNKEGNEISSYPLGHPHGREKNMYLVNAQIPDQSFRVELLAYGDGKCSSLPITRISHVQFVPETFSISLSPTLPDTIVSGSRWNVEIFLYNMMSFSDLFNLTLEERDRATKKELFHASWSNMEVDANSSFPFPLTIILNSHKAISEMEFSINCISSKGMTQTIRKEIVVLPSKNVKKTTITQRNSRGRTIKDSITSSTRLPSSISTGLSSLVSYKHDLVETTSHLHIHSTFSTAVFSSKHKFTKHPKRPRRTTRKPTTKFKDLKPPSFSMIRFKDRCKHKETCSLYQWTVFFQVQDNESGIHRIDVEDKTFSTVITESFSDGQANIPIHGKISTTCCHGDIAIIVEDKQGNRLRYPVKYSDHVAQDSGFSFNTYSGIVVGSLACVMLFIIVVTAIVHFRTKFCFRRQSGFSYRQTINGAPPKSKRTRIRSAQIV